MRRHPTLSYSLILLLLAAGTLLGCNRQEEKLSELSTQLQRSVDQARATLDGLRPQERASEEIEKLFMFEYQVVEIPSTIDAAALQTKLAALGADRWELVSVTSHDDNMRYIFKRLPRTYLRYVPRWLP